MKNLLSSLIFFSIALPSLSFGATTQEELLNYINTGSTTGTTTNTTTTQSNLTQEEQNRLYEAFTNPNSQNTNPALRNFSPEELEYFKMGSGETLDQYFRRVQTQNAIRRSEGLPEYPLTTSTNPSAQDYAQQPSLDGKAPDLATILGNNTQTRQSTEVSLAPSELLNQLTNNDFGGGLSGILNQLFYAGLILAVVLAIFMIIRGGLEYMTIDIASTKEAAKNRIKAAIGGLILCFSTILILNTINPGLTRLQLNFPQLSQLRTVTFQGVELKVVATTADGGGIARGPNGEVYTVDANNTVTGDTGSTVKGDFSNITAADLRPHLGSNYSDADVQAFIDAGKQYGLDPRFLASVSKFETANGTSKAFTDGRNNAMGTSNDVGPIGFSSVRASIFAQANSLTRQGGYYTGASTIQQIGNIYSPSKDPKTGKPYANDINGTNWSWAGNVASNYNKMTGGNSGKATTDLP